MAQLNFYRFVAFVILIIAAITDYRERKVYIMPVIVLFCYGIFCSGHPILCSVGLCSCFLQDHSNLIGVGDISTSFVILSMFGLQGGIKVILYALIFGCVWYLIKRYEKIPLVTFMGVSAGMVVVKNWILFIAGA